MARPKGGAFGRRAAALCWDSTPRVGTTHPGADVDRETRGDSRCRIDQDSATTSPGAVSMRSTTTQRLPEGRSSPTNSAEEPQKNCGGSLTRRTGATRGTQRRVPRPDELAPIHVGSIPSVVDIREAFALSISFHFSATVEEPLRRKKGGSGSRDGRAAIPRPAPGGASPGGLRSARACRRARGRPIL